METRYWTSQGSAAAKRKSDMLNERANRRNESRSSITENSYRRVPLQRRRQDRQDKLDDARQETTGQARQDKEGKGLD